MTINKKTVAKWSKAIKAIIEEHSELEGRLKAEQETASLTVKGHHSLQEQIDIMEEFGIPLGDLEEKLKAFLNE